MSIEPLPPLAMRKVRDGDQALSMSTGVSWLDSISHAFDSMCGSESVTSC